MAIATVFRLTLRKPVVVRADTKQVRIYYQGQLVACHQRSYSRRELVIEPEHRLEALKLRHRQRASDLQQSFDALGSTAKIFHLGLLTQPVRERTSQTLTGTDSTLRYSRSTGSNQRGQ